jgi:hypothetical protein
MIGFGKHILSMIPTFLCPQQLQNVVEPAEKEEAERSVKKRVMGTMRLISELYKKDMVRDWIITTCLESLLAKDKGKSTASEDSIEVGSVASKPGLYLINLLHVFLVSQHHVLFC